MERRIDTADLGTDETAQQDTDEPFEALTLLQVLRCKGEAPVAAVATATGWPPATVAQQLSALSRRGDCAWDGQRARLTSAGKQRLAELLAAQLRTLDPTEIRSLAAEFELVNSEFKALLTEWQCSQADFDCYADRFDALHRRTRAVLDRLAALVPRLAAYPQRLDHAARTVRSGDPSWLASPLCDSYHTVWFELHQELIDLTGTDRATRETAEESG